MAFSPDVIFRRGGKALIDLLEFSVRAGHTDVVFVFLVEEFRQHPTAPKAVALYDIFCAPQAPARLSAPEIIPPSNIRLEAVIRPLKLNLAQRKGARSGATVAPPPILPAKYLFDSIDFHLRENSTVLRAVRRNYRIRRTPLENLPGGRMTAHQRRFVEKVWEPQLRPRLVEAGFRRVASVA